ADTCIVTQLLLRILGGVLVLDFIHMQDFFFQAEDGIRDFHVTGVQTCALPISQVLRNPLALRLIHLHVSGMGWKSIKNLLNFDPRLEEVYSLHQSELAEILQLNKYNAKKIYSSLKEIEPNSILEKYSKQNIQVITILDNGYPELLKNIYQPPWVLYCKGDLSLLKENLKIAVVGSREPTSYGVEVTKWLVKKLAENKIIVVSGFAKGIDTKAHEGTIHAGGKTIGVLGGGFFHLYPKENEALDRKSVV